MQKLFTLGVAALSIMATSFTASAAEKDYMVVDLSGGVEVEKYPVTYLDAIPEGGWTVEYKTTKIVLLRLAPGTFTMGSPSDEIGRTDDETQHEVTITKPFYIGVFEVTQKQWELVMGKTPTIVFPGDTHPIHNVRYYDVRGKQAGSQYPVVNEVEETSFMGRLRAKTGQVFDLPTDAQWEYACRAGTTTTYSNGKTLTTLKTTFTDIDEIAWHKANCDKQLHPVGEKQPNPWGLYDIHGNVYEWCLDWLTPDLGTAAVSDPISPEASPTLHRVVRGGGISYDAYRCRSGHRKRNLPEHTTPAIGLRVVCLPIAHKN